MPTWWQDDCACSVLDASGDGCGLSTDTDEPTHLCRHCKGHAATPTPQPEALDVERLARAIDAADAHEWNVGGARKWAAAIAREYAALAAREPVTETEQRAPGEAAEGWRVGETRVLADFRTALGGAVDYLDMQAVLREMELQSSDHNSDEKSRQMWGDAADQLRHALASEMP